MMIYRVKEQTIMDFSKRKPIKRKEVFIVQCDDKNKNMWIPSPLTEYLHHYHSTHSPNTKVKSARVICEFINYLNKQVSLGEDACLNVLKGGGLYALNHSHLSKFINHISNKSEKECSYKTVKSKEEILIKFYSFLYQRGITNDDAKILRKIAPVLGTGKYSKKRGHYILISPFEDSDNFTITYPEKNRAPSKVLKDMNQDIWEQLIEYAEYYYPNIALGVAFQCMGGVRMGEIVNLTRDSVKLFRNQKHMRLDIQDRQFELFRERDINEKKSQVKHPRINQPVFNFNGRLFEIWDNHVERLNSNPKINNRMALFVDNEGKAMSGDSYEKYFYQLKNNFINLLGSEAYQYLEKELRVHKWGTHIGRHIFTNHLIKIGAVNTSEGKPNPEYLRILRGDDSIYSSADYIDEKAVIETVIDKINLISDSASEL